MIHNRQDKDKLLDELMVKAFRDEYVTRQELMKVVEGEENGERKVNDLIHALTGMGVLVVDSVVDPLSESMEVGEFLKRKRLEQGLFLREVAAMIGITESMMCHIERGSRIPTHARGQIEKLAGALDVDRSELTVRCRIARGELPPLSEDKIKRLAAVERAIIEA